MRRTIIVLLFFFSGICSYGQKVIFLHHSTGGWLYYQGDVANWFLNYNSKNGSNYQVSERSYPDSPYDWANYPYDYWNLWINNVCNNSDPDIECMDKLARDYNVIIFKHCFPGAGIVAADGNPSVKSNIPTLDNYKLQYRALRSLMDSYPNNKFIVWTLVPLHRLATDPEMAARSKQFVDWVKNSWLSEDLKAHPNIYIFDFFGYAAESNPTPQNGLVNCLKYEYEGDHNLSDSHPNELANKTIGPVFAEFIVNTIKNQTTVINSSSSNNLVNVFPNPSSSEISIDLKDFDVDNVSVEIFDLQGRLVCRETNSNKKLMHISTQKLNSGLYIIRTKAGLNSIQQKLYIVK